MGEKFPQNKLNLADSEDEKEEELAQSIDMFQNQSDFLML